MAALFWFGLRDVGILQIFYSRAVIQRTIVDFTVFSEKIRAHLFLSFRLFNILLELLYQLVLSFHIFSTEKSVRTIQKFYE